MLPCLFGQFRPVLTLFFNFVRRKKEERTTFSSTRVVSFAATKKLKEWIIVNLWRNLFLHEVSFIQRMSFIQSISEIRTDMLTQWRRKRSWTWDMKKEASSGRPLIWGCQMENVKVNIVLTQLNLQATFCMNSIHKTQNTFIAINQGNFIARTKSIHFWRELKNGQVQKNRNRSQPRITRLWARVSAPKQTDRHREKEGEREQCRFLKDNPTVILKRWINEITTLVHIWETHKDVIF